MKIIFEGHACFQLVDNDGTTILLDPYISGNPHCRKQPADFKPQLILLSHGHGDHVGDAPQIARLSGATLAGAVDLLHHLPTEGLKTIAFNMGGSIRFGNIKITMTPAWHGSNYQGHYAGLACGYMIELAGKTVYFAGDTALFGDMATLLARYGIDYALLPIGDFYTMGPDDAVTAAHWLQAKQIIPMHYNTFPEIAQDAQAFKSKLEDKTDSRCQILEPGQSLEV